MSDKSDVAIRGVKELDREVTAWKMRLDGVKSDVESLKREKESLQGQVAQIRAAVEAEVSQKMGKARVEESRLMEENKKLDEAKKTFEATLLDFKRERIDVDKQLTEVMAIRKEVSEARTRIGKFVSIVRKESENL